MREVRDGESKFNCVNVQDTEIFVQNREMFEIEGSRDRVNCTCVCVAMLFDEQYGAALFSRPVSVESLIRR